MDERAYFSDGTLYLLRERLTASNASRQRITEYVYDSEFPAGVTRVRPDGMTVPGAISGGTIRWRYGYDGLKRLTSESLELGSSSPTHPAGVVRIQTGYGYDSLDRVVSVTRPDGSTTVTDYDEDGNPWRVRAQYANGVLRR